MAQSFFIRTWRGIAATRPVADPRRRLGGSEGWCGCLTSGRQPPPLHTLEKRDGSNGWRRGRGTAWAGTSLRSVVYSLGLRRPQRERVYCANFREEFHAEPAAERCGAAHEYAVDAPCMSACHRTAGACHRENVARATLHRTNEQAHQYGGLCCCRSDSPRRREGREG